MPARHAVAIIVDSVTFTAGQTENADVSEFHTPAVCVALENLEGNADDTLTIEIVGDAGTYTVDERTIGGVGGDQSEYVVNVPQAKQVKLTSANGTTISAEARNNPR